MIKTENGILRYFDKNGDEIHAGDMLRFPDGSLKMIYLTEKGCLGTDATNPAWIENGRAVPCEFGIYPLNEADTNKCIIEMHESEV